MKKIKELLTVAICALLVISPVMTETVSAAGMKESVADFTSGMRSGWVTTANGRKYQRNGKFVKGCQKVGMNYYFSMPMVCCSEKCDWCRKNILH